MQLIRKNENKLPLFQIYESQDCIRLLSLHFVAFRTTLTTITETMPQFTVRNEYLLKEVKIAVSIYYHDDKTRSDTLKNE